MTELQNRLFAMRDDAYRTFQCKLMPTVDPETVIGVRTPQLRKLAKEFAGTEQASAFLAELPHRYYEENNLHAFLIERIGDYHATVAALDAFLPFVDNWATCDSLSPKCFRRHRVELRGEIDRWLALPHTYTVRFAIKLLMTEYLDDGFLPSDADRLAAIRSEEYYIRMMVAWYFATALAKRYDDVLPYLRGDRLDPWTKAMTIRKARESYRVTDAHKAELQRLLQTENGGNRPPMTCVSLATGKEIPMPAETVICLGNFDGVHRGHRALIETARETRDRAFSKAACGVFCFRELSSDLLFKQPPEHLTTPKERLRLIAEAGAEIVILVNFADVRNLTPERFVNDLLKNGCGCVAAVCGFNYRFGKNAVGTPETLQRLLGAPVTVCEAVMDGGEPISATRIRAALKEGKAEDAARMMGYPYTVEANVWHGKALGRKLGFPTVNQSFPPCAIVPRFGVYATDCTVEGKRYRGVTNVGVRPTVDDPSAPANCETYLIGYSGGDLYGKTVRVSFLTFLRPERMFPSVEALREQIARDAETAKIVNPADHP